LPLSFSFEMSLHLCQGERYRLLLVEPGRVPLPREGTQSLGRVFNHRPVDDGNAFCQDLGNMAFRKTPSHHERRGFPLSLAQGMHNPVSRLGRGYDEDELLPIGQWRATTTPETEAEGLTDL
jgi:hypothetical protein